jgi:hypothetical protein
MSLVRKELIRPDRRRDDGAETYRFRHLLIRDAAYESLPKAERAELHERFADWLELAAGDRLAELDEIMGYHLDQARAYRLALGPEDEHTRTLALRAGRRLAAAGRRAADREDVRAAARLLSQAEVLLAEDAPVRFETLLTLVHTFINEDYAAALLAARQAEAVGAELGELAALRARLWVWTVQAMTDPNFRFSDHRLEVERARAAFQAAGDVDAVLDTYQVMALMDVNVAHWEATATSAREGLELATQAGRDRIRGDMTTRLANAVVWGSSPASEAVATVARLLDAESRRLSRSTLLSGLALLRAILGDRPGAEAAYEESRAIDAELGLRSRRFREAYMEYVLDDLPAALRVARAEAMELEQRGETGQRSTMLGLQAWILTLLGDDEAAARTAEEARQLSAPDDAVSQILWRAAAGVAKAHLGEGEEADRITREAIDVAEGTDSMDAGTEWEARATVLTVLGRTAEARSAALRARELYGLKGAVNLIRRVDAMLASEALTP